MATRKQFLNTVRKWNATMVEYPSHDGRTINIDPPEGTYWTATDEETTCIVGVHYDGWPISEVYDDLIERMNHGVTTLPESSMNINK